MIKVAIVSHNDADGGADRAANRLHQSLLQREGVDSVMYVNKSTTMDPTVIVPGGKFTRFIYELRPRLGRITDPLYTSPDQGKLSPAIFSSKWPQILNRLDVDIVHLHWPMNEMMSVADISRIKKPLVWTMHDMWAFCGAEHYATDNRYRTGYTRGNRPATEKGFDLNGWTWKRKIKHWKTPINIITPSRWMGECVKSSQMMGDWPIHIIPGAIDIKYWKPFDRQSARELLGLPLDKSLVLFGAIGGTSDYRKGFNLLEEALAKLKVNKEEIALVVIGGKGHHRSDHDDLFDTYYLGHLYDNMSLKTVYNAVDVVLLPSRQDNLPNMGVEAMACGVPVVAFNTCGLPDIVQHKSNGWLADAFDTAHFSEGISWVLENEERKRTLSQNARKYAIKHFSSEEIANKHYNFYKSILE